MTFYFHHCQLCKRWATSLLQWKTDTSYHESWHNHRWAIGSKVDFFHRSGLLLRGHPHSIPSELNIGCRPLGGQAGWCHLSELQVGWCRNGCWDGYRLEFILRKWGKGGNKVNSNEYIGWVHRLYIGFGRYPSQAKIQYRKVQKGMQNEEKACWKIKCFLIQQCSGSLKTSG